MTNITHGFATDRLPRIDAAVANLIGPKKLSGAVTLLSRNGEIVHRCEQGSMDLERNKPMQRDALFRLYSMTKPITCVAMMMLIEQGLARLADPASRFLPAFKQLQVLGPDGALHPLQREVTLRDLFNHTAGLTYHFLDYGDLERRYRETTNLGEGELAGHIDQLLTLPLGEQPGTRFRYSESHDVLARIVEVISGQSYADFLRQNILGPLGMADTDFYVSPRNAHRLAAMYGSLVITDPKVTSVASIAEAMQGKYTLLADPASCPESRPHNAFRGGNGLVGSIDDYHRFCLMLLNGGELDRVRLLGRKTVELMTTNTLAPAQLPYEIGGVYSPGYGIGLGMRVMMDSGAAGIPGSVGEFGWGGAACTYFWIDPRERMIGISMAQYLPGGLMPLGQDFRMAAYQALL